MEESKVEEDKVRGFEVVADWARTHKDLPVTLPHRGTKQSAGYDFHSLLHRNIMPGATVAFETDVKAYMQPDEVLHLYPRSSMGITRGLVIANTIPTIDSDYYGNKNNDGHIVIFLRNTSNENVSIKSGERIAQGIFSKFLTADNKEDDLPERVGGVGSTGR
jgi:dUTP pyrophosphatase